MNQNGIAPLIIVAIIVVVGVVAGVGVYVATHGGGTSTGSTGGGGGGDGGGTSPTEVSLQAIINNTKSYFHKQVISVGIFENTGGVEWFSTNGSWTSGLYLVNIPEGFIGVVGASYRVTGIVTTCTVYDYENLPAIQIMQIEPA
jgi:hypothetical protein